MDKRYEIASKHVGDNDFVVDLNSGNSRFRNYCKNYISNDLYYEESDYHLPDDEFKDVPEKADVISCFGVGGYEISGNKVESMTISDSIVEMVARLQPHTMIVESIEKYLPILETLLERTGYELREKHELDFDFPHPEPYVLRRRLYICTRPTKNT